MKFTLLLLLVMTGATFAHDPQPLISPFTAQPPVIDGDLSDWDRATFLQVTPNNGVFDGESDVADGPEDLSFSFARPGMTGFKG